MSYLKTIGLFDRLVKDAPFNYTGPNVPEVRDVIGCDGDENMCEAEKRGLTYLFKIRHMKTVLSSFRQYENWQST